MLLAAPLLSQEAQNLWKKYQEISQSKTERQIIVVDNLTYMSKGDQLGRWVRQTPGVRISQLARQFNASEQEIRKANNLDWDTIYYYRADWLFIPYSSADLQQLLDSGQDRNYLEIEKSAMIWPIEGERLTSGVGPRWGRQHAGLDIAAPVGTLVVAAEDGVVKLAEKQGGFGNLIEIDHGNGIYTRYAHLQGMFVKDSELVRKGQAIGLSGNTGFSTGPHLHFEVRLNTLVLNPEMFLPEFVKQSTATAYRQQKLNAK